MEILDYSGGIPLDYAYSNVAAEIDRGIRDTIKGIRLSILAMGIALARMREKVLHRELGFRSITGYIEQLCVENRMERSSMFSWLSIGEVYLRHQSELEEIGFNDSDGPTKLLYMDKALEKTQKEEVFEKIKNMSVREFKAFSRSSAGAGIKIKAARRKVTIQGNEVYIGNTKAITLSSALNKRFYAYFKKVILIAGKALEEGGAILPVHLYDMDEATRMEPVIEKLLEKTRTDTT